MVDMLYLHFHNMSTNLYTGNSILLPKFYKDQDESWKAEGRFPDPKEFILPRQDLQQTWSRFEAKRRLVMPGQNIS